METFLLSAEATDSFSSDEQADKHQESEETLAQSDNEN